MKAHTNFRAPLVSFSGKIETRGFLRGRLFGFSRLDMDNSFTVALSRSKNTTPHLLMSTLLHELLHLWFSVCAVLIKDFPKITVKQEHQMIEKIEAAFLEDWKTFFGGAKK